MNFRKRAQPVMLGFQIAPMVDVLLVLLVFFIVTWNFALSENEIEVKVPTAASATEPQPLAHRAVINVRKDGTVVMNRQELSLDQLRQKLTQLSGLYPDYTVTLRADGKLVFEDFIAVMDTCRQANITNLDFATALTPSQPASAATPAP